MTPNQARVLVVDDNDALREAIREVVLDCGVTDVDEAADGAHALQCFTDTPYDVVVTDWNMPRLDGIGLLKAIRAGATRRDTPVLVLSGDVTTLRVVEALEAGANGFIAKPFITPALPQKLLRLLATLAPVSLFEPHQSGHTASVETLTGL